MLQFCAENLVMQSIVKTYVPKYEISSLVAAQKAVIAPFKLESPSQYENGLRQ